MRDLFGPHDFGLPASALNSMTRNREHFDDQSPDRWIERQLRRIPLPAGFLRRLRRIAGSTADVEDHGLSDDCLDVVLRDVPLPAGMLERLGKIASFDPGSQDKACRETAPVDAALRDVPLPHGLTDRLSAIAAPEDDKLARELHDVPVPSAMLERLKRIPSETSQQGSDEGKKSRTKSSLRESVATRQRRRRSSYSWQWASAMALSIALLISLVYFGSEHLQPIIAEFQPGQSESSVVDSRTNGEEKRGNGLVEPGTDRASASEDAASDDFALLDADGSDATEDAYVDNEPFWWPFVPAPHLPSETIETPVPELRDLPRYFTTDPSRSRPALDAVSSPQWRGISPPWADAEALTAQIRTGFHPFVSPAKHREFRTRRLPLHTGRDSFDWATATIPEERLRGRRLAWWRARLASHVRTEDFINAVNYHYPSPSKRALALRAYGGTSPFGIGPDGQGRVQILQLGVQAAPSRATTSRHATHLVVIVDTSPSMMRHNRLAPVRWALNRLLDSLEPHEGKTKPFDRITIVTTTYQPRGASPRIESAGSNRLAELREVVASLQSAPNQDVAAAMRLGARIANENSQAEDNRCTVAWITDGTDGYGEASTSWRSELEQSLLSLTAPLTEGNQPIDGETTVQQQGDTNESSPPAINLQVVGVAKSDSLAGESSEDDEHAVDMPWFKLLQKIPGSYSPAKTSEAIYWALLQSLRGQSQIVAHNTEVEITFNPETVAAYRLLGHEATTIVGQESESLRIDMHASQTATVLLELQLKSTGSDTVATAKLSWQDARTNRVEEQIQRLSRWQFAPTFEESAISLQLATVAAATAEALRQSIHTSPAGQSIAAVRSLAAGVHPVAAEESSFEPLQRLLRRAENAGF